MVKRLFGRKLGMTRLFIGEGQCVGITALKVGPCIVTQKKSIDKDGYNAIQVGFDPQKEQRTNKPLQGHFKAVDGKCFSHLREIRVDDPDAFEVGQELTSDVFEPGDIVTVVGNSKGRGFAGVVKRWGFAGGRDTHGCRSHRVPGSIGSSATPGRVYKGRKMPGRMGSQRTTVKNLTVIDVRPEMDVVLVKGAVPGAKNGLIEIAKAG
jgi:large subunit ribosomal protein L3